jgi:predicted Rossmann fold nucleotide-binding protein DprA/Smf involved in DNA uptake
MGDKMGTKRYHGDMTETLSSLRRSLTDALTDGRSDDAAQMLGDLEDEANAALAAGELAAIVSIRGRMSRLRRAAATVDAQWDGVQRMLVLDRALGSALTGMQLALRRELPVPIPERVTEAAERHAPRPTIRQRVLNALDDKPRRPVELGQRTGVPKRQLQRALGELVAAGKARPVAAAAEDDRAAFYQRVA